MSSTPFARATRPRAGPGAPVPAPATAGLRAAHTKLAGSAGLDGLSRRRPPLQEPAQEPAQKPAPPRTERRAAGIHTAPITPRAFSCRCGRPVFFGNSRCLACGTQLGYAPGTRELLSLEPVVEGGQGGGEREGEGEGAENSTLWRRATALAGRTEPEPEPARYWRCSNLDTAAACNWLVDEDDLPPGSQPLCRCCRLTRTLPDLSVPEHPLWWNRIESAKRRLVSSLIGLELPVQSKTEDPARGWVFDLLRSTPGLMPVVTGHADGVITLDVEEADDAWREQRRTALAEPYRTLLGHLRHESGHYYWQRLVEPGRWLRPFRETFGDERQDYAAALQRYYSLGAPADWGGSFVSSYASSHPWEDWAETWAHYLHLVDTLDTARSFGIDGERVELRYERFGAELVGAADAQGQDFVNLINGWMELTGVLNELSRSTGVADFYPFVLSVAAVKKLYFVHRVIAAREL